MTKINKNWFLKFKKKLTKDSSSQEILSILLKNRGVKKTNLDEFLRISSPDKITPGQVGIKKSELKKAKKVIEEIGKENLIIIYGDYDVDGLTATAIIWEALWKQGYNVIPFIPDRKKDGYGLNPKSVKRLKKENPKLSGIITVDNGIVAIKGVKAAKDLGLKVVITDHHLPADSLPPADAIVQTVKLAGVGVSWFLAKEFGPQIHDLVAIGTIADMMPLVSANRSFVKFGLRELCVSKRIGLQLLKAKIGIKPDKEILPWQVSFLIAPRLNAAGRLNQAIDALRLICTKDKKKAAELVDKLNNINNQRQDLTLLGLEHAKKNFVNNKDLITIAESKNYHLGVIGLIAGKLMESCSKPAIAISKGKEISKGSARSVPGVNILDLIKSQKKFLIDVGGHKMAAGFSLKTKNLEKFIKALKKDAKKEIDKKDLIPKLKIDAEIDFALISKRFYVLIQELSPFGFGNPEPIFLIKNARIVKLQALGKEKAHLKLHLDDPETEKIEKIVAEAIGFGFGNWQKNLDVGDLVDLAASIDLNYWNGRETIQLKIKDLRKSD